MDPCSIPAPGACQAPETKNDLAAEGLRRYWAAEHLAREAERAAISAAAAAEIGELTHIEGWASAATREAEAPG